MRLRFVGTTQILTLDGFYPAIFSYRQLCPIMCLYSVIGSIGVSALSVQFFYRYYTLENDKPPPTFLILLALTICVAPCVIVSPKTSTIFCPAENANAENVDYGQLWFEEVPVPPLYVQLPSAKSIWFNSSIVLTTFFYSVAVFYGVLTIVKLKNKFSVALYSKSAKSLQRQLTRTMIAQSILPLTVLVIPQCLHQLVVNMDIANERFAELSKQSLALVPIFNMLAYIIFIKPYRRFCLRFLPCSKYYNWSCIIGAGPATVASRMPSSNK